MIFLWLSDKTDDNFDDIAGDDLLKKAYRLWSNIVKFEDYETFKNEISSIKDKIFKFKSSYPHLTTVFQEVLNVLNYKSLDIEKDELVMANIGRFNELLTDYETAHWYGGRKSSLKYIVSNLYWYIKTYAMNYYDEQEVEEIKDL